MFFTHTFGTILALACAAGAMAQPITTAFTYQGALTSAGVPAAGPLDLRFRLYTAPSGGTQVGSTQCADNVVIADGLFTVSLDFGAQFAGQQRFLEIDVRADTGLACSNTTGYVTLTPRQPLTATPNSLFAMNAAAATTAAQLNGQAASFYQNATNLSTGTIASARLAGVYGGVLTLNNAANAFSGSGAGLTGLSASNIDSGTLNEARLTGNVALLNSEQSFSVTKTFSVAPSFAAAGSPFLVTGTGLVANLNADRLDGLDSTAFLTSIPNPLTLAGSSPTHIIRGENTFATSSSSAGVYGISTSTANVGNGVYGQCDSSGNGVNGVSTKVNGSGTGVVGVTQGFDGFGVRGIASNSSGDGVGVFGSSSGEIGIGVWGRALGGPGTTYGGYFTSASAEGIAIYAEATASTGTTIGVHGKVRSPGGSAVFGEAPLGTGAAIGIHGSVASPTGYAGYFEGQSYFSSNVGIGTTAPGAKLDVRGNISTTGTITIPVTTRFLTLSPYAFHSTSHGDAFQTAFLGASLYVDALTNGQTVEFAAAVNLPHGAVVTRFAATVYDDDTIGGITVELSANLLDDGTGVAMASVTSGGVNAPGRITLVDTTISNALIRNDVAAYWVRANWQEPITAGLDIRLGSIRIDYTIASPLP